VAGTHRIPFVEDACQAWLGEWRGKPLGTAGIAGCFSFQATKHLTAGEGGAVVTNDENFAHQVYNFHAPGGAKPVASSGRGANFRLTEFQAGILLAQLARLEQHAKVRDENAAYLSELLRTIPGIAPAGLTPGCTRSAYHMYMMRYDRRHFADLPRARFLRALGEEGVRAGGGYSPLNTSAHVRAIASHPHYLRIYGPEAMAGWTERNQCPVNDRLCQEAFVLPHTRMLGRRSEMEQIAEAILRVQKRAAEIARA
jgi:dTDP-4-amino-4,6-dideoxygalactose transaminase